MQCLPCGRKPPVKEGFEPPEVRHRPTREDLLDVDDDTSLNGSLIDGLVAPEPPAGARTVPFINVSSQIIKPRALAVGVALSALPLCVFCALFSTLGFAVEVHGAVQRHPEFTLLTGLVCIGCALAGWCAQVSVRARWVAAPISLLCFTGIALLAVTEQESAPELPLFLLLCSFPVWVLAARSLVHRLTGRPIEAHLLFATLSRSLVISACALSTIWIAVYARRLTTAGAIPAELHRISETLAAHDAEAEESRLLRLSALLREALDWDPPLPQPTPSPRQLLAAAYMLWLAPLLAASGCTFYALLCAALTNATTPIERLLSRTLLILAATIYVAVGVASVAMRFARVVVLFALGGVVGAFAALLVHSALALEDLTQGRRLGNDKEAVQVRVGAGALGGASKMMWAMRARARASAAGAWVRLACSQHDHS
jgi:hypothetical protein